MRINIQSLHQRITIGFSFLILSIFVFPAFAETRIAGEYSNEKLLVKVAPDTTSKDADKYAGEIVMGKRRYPFKATLQDKKLTGKFVDKDKDEFEFYATLDGTRLTFVTDNTTYKLQARDTGIKIGGAALQGTGNPFEGIFKDDKISIEISLDHSSPGAFAGTITHGNEKYTLKADRIDGILKGKFNVGADNFSFTAEMKDAVLVFKTGDDTYYLKRPLMITAGSRAVAIPVQKPKSNKPVVSENPNDVPAEESKVIGIGVQMRVMSTGDWLVTGVVPESSAARAGILANDIIFSVDGKAIHRVENPSELIRGESGTKVRVVVERIAENGVLEHAEYTLTRSLLKGQGN